jgi:riboflavin synthase
MFTGIIETMGRLVAIDRDKNNVQFTFTSGITGELRVDQSLSHNGVCLTVVKINGDLYSVTAIEETLKKTNLGDLAINDWVNLERCMPANGRFDGHIVQGHVDTTALCDKIIEHGGSWEYIFNYEPQKSFLTVEKGSITVNGVSLTVVNSQDSGFSVHVIPYTFENTNFRNLKPGDRVNLEFDVVGKYVAKLLSRQ